MSPEQITAAPEGAVLHDDKVRGLHVRVFGGKRVFYLYFRTKLGRQRRPKLGEVGILTLTKAREMARAMLAEVAAGGDPVAERERDRTVPTVGDLWTFYKAHDAPAKSLSQYEELYDRFLGPRLGGDRVTAIQRADIERIHRALAASPFQANRVVALAGSLFTCAERRGWIAPGSNPARGIRRYPEPSRERYITPDEGRAILAALARRAEAYPRPVGFILLCLFTGARPDEIARARPEWITGSVLRVPDSKTGRRTIHLSPQALAIIEWLRPHARNGTITGADTYPYSTWWAVREQAGCPDLRLYDLRHTFASIALAATGSLDVTGRLLGHVKADTTLVYAHLITDAGTTAASVTGSMIEEKLLGAPLALPGIAGPKA
jgi:integrase